MSVSSVADILLPRAIIADTKETRDWYNGSQVCLPHEFIGYQGSVAQAECNFLCASQTRRVHVRLQKPNKCAPTVVWRPKSSAPYEAATAGRCAQQLN